MVTWASDRAPLANLVRTVITTAVTKSSLMLISELVKLRRSNGLAILEKTRHAARLDAKYVRIRTILKCKYRTYVRTYFTYFMYLRYSSTK